MTNHLSRNNDFTRQEMHAARRGGAPSADDAGRRATSAAGFDPQRAETNSLNEFMTNKLLSALPPEDFSRLFPNLEPVSLVVGEVLYNLDAEMRHAYFPETAVVSHLHVLNEGGMTEADMVGREGLTGLSALFDAPAPSYLTEVSLAGSAFRIRLDALRQEFLRGGALHQLLLKYASARIALLARRAVCNGNHRVDERLCVWLLMMHDRSGGQPLALTHERISRYLGTRRAGVTGAATTLRDRGLISYTRGYIRILDRAMLEASACECYPAVRESYNAVA
jgi:CRP-like cAMP-binding protein